MYAVVILDIIENLYEHSCINNTFGQNKNKRQNIILKIMNKLWNKINS